MKKTTAVLLSLLIFAVLPLQCFAGTPAQAPDADITGTEKAGGDFIYRFSVDFSEGEAYETAREQALKKAREAFSDDEIKNSSQAYLLYPACIRADAVINGERVFIKAFDIKTKSLSLSYTKDILPAVAKTPLLTEEFLLNPEFDIAFFGAVFIDGGYADFTLNCTLFPENPPAAFMITYDLPDDAVNSSENPSFVLYPFDGEISLQKPSRTGYGFTGWKDEKGEYTGKISGEKTINRVFSEWEAETYKLGYIVTTRNEYAFARIKNKNPETFTYGNEIKLFDLTPPENWFFGGWYDNENFEGEKITVIPADNRQDVMLWAKWESREENEAARIKAAHIGDLNDDGKVNVDDARLALRVAVKLETVDSGFVKRADFSLTGFIAVDDARMILRIAVKLEDLDEISARLVLGE